eukprot:3609807-Prorocentrum_lima.AAC.1
MHFHYDGKKKVLAIQDELSLAMRETCASNGRPGKKRQSCWRKCGYPSWPGKSPPHGHEWGTHERRQQAV